MRKRLSIIALSSSMVALISSCRGVLLILDFDSSAFSPPENDDNFLCIRYPRRQQKQQIAEEPQLQVKTVNVSPAGDIITGGNTGRVDITKHTAQCKDHFFGRKEPQSQILNSNGKPKSAGTDDGFKGSGAACGTSVIRVATQMVSGKVVKGFETFEDDEKEHMQTMGFDPKLRRGSRSLPASPLQSPSASPKSKRKLAANKFFTGGGGGGSSSAYAEDKKPGSILANLLAKRDPNLSRSVSSVISEEDVADNLAARLQTLNVVPNAAAAAATTTAHQPKPSHLREMNFWSPTSM
ncbi:PREDICTED: uncharacterized protein LOC108569096 isoform X2 [Nicrophorus vespilloides]|uniref:Uncharacterized protein LOC108569096 isoform X2 n=1 Tax=Nicrophorus vespilloides TaxID=110193 RepID=A0ABM1NGQ4_NICVS|nr:PREDICTED: uncharacterized protein LOC108569096 isoform X2 [Nicrophorus vespilloides]